MRICVIGSRSIVEEKFVFAKIDKFLKEHCVGNPVLVSGGAKGVDSIVKKYAEAKGFDFIEFIPYHLLDKSVEFSSRYFFTRNRQMIMNADKVLALWDGTSTGTHHAIKFCQKLGVPVMVIKVPQED